MNSSMSHTAGKFRIWFLILLAGFTTAIVAYLLFASPATPEISEQSYKLVTQGMNLREIELLVGGPPGRYGSFVVFDVHSVAEKWAGEKTRSEVWQTEDGFLCVGFSADGRACEKFFLFGRTTPSNKGYFNQLRIFLFRHLHSR